MAWDCIVVGAGVSGLLAARWLADTGLRVLVIDKGWTVGGRLASRKVGIGLCNHGSPCFQATDPRFARLVTEWRCAGLLTEMKADSCSVTPNRAAEFQPSRGMAGFAQALAAGLSAHNQERVLKLAATDGIWEVTTDWRRTYRSAAVILTPPMPQALALLDGSGFQPPVEAVSALASVYYDSSFLLIAQLDGTSRVPAPGVVKPVDGPLRVVADNRALAADRGDGPLLTIETTPAFAAEHWADPDDAVAGLIRDASQDFYAGQIRSWQLKRWRYRTPVNPLDQTCAFWAGPPALGFAGDAFGEGSVQGAALSGLAVAERLIESEIESLEAGDELDDCGGPLDD